MTLYKHHSEVPASVWRWPNFTPAEVACKGTGELLVNEEALDALQKFRDDVARPVILNSAYRSQKHNAAVGGSPTSQHRLGKAFDVRITDRLTRSVIHAAARAAGFRGVGDYDTFVHLDIGPSRYWDNRSKR